MGKSDRRRDINSMNDSPSYTVSLEPLSAAAFAPFGDVASRPTGERRRYLPTMQNRADEAKSFSLWISGAVTLGRLPLRATMLERHPYSAQTFVPLGSARYLAVVCSAAPDGDPDLTMLRGFIASPDQVVTYARNVWHHPMTVLDAPMEFAVAMGVTGLHDDDVFFGLDVAVTIVMPPARL
ncbi:ureidoglycolate hydrolase [Bradyrhizobium sp. CSA207]|uniref:ureidoglycolate lyase n=1 Tax=Bradyrhizobium sp. CSA207 TaxID=2698826 RepID=UPI0023B093DA|nr:ureidoglycolate lyase [Bradyrhizobium sp. CSA207]MDE5444426.1 ureidoglycolate hydrolase [Bradyrhizobium sp. CSA207]